MSDRPFKFKQFVVKQDLCAMKIGTDGVLLGAWAGIEHAPNTILDIGAGTGILSLMMAQRSEAELIDAIELDDAAYEQCVENFEASPWADRLFCYHASFQEFTDEIDDTYDLIVCNPPFHSEDFKTSNRSRDLARFQEALPFEQLLHGVTKLLSPDGRFCLIIPFKDEESFIDLAKDNGLYLVKILRLRGTDTSKIRRSLLELSFNKGNHTVEELIIEKGRHDYTSQYKELTKEFYLKL